MYMLDKGWRPSDSGSTLLHLDIGNGTMPLNLRQKFPLYVVFIVLYEFSRVWNCLSLIYPPSCCMLVVWWVVLHCLSLTFYFPLFWNYLFLNVCVVSACCINLLYRICLLLQRVVRVWCVVLDGVELNIPANISFYDMYWKPFIYCRNWTNYQ